MSPARRAAARVIVALLVGVPVVALASPASAACHIAAFTDNSVPVNENAGQATLTVELVGGQPTCAGSVEYATANGSAQAPSDYTARQGTLTFQANDDRRETITVPIVNDSADEPSESFTVRLSGGTGGISADDTATVTIADNDPAPQPSSSAPRPSSSTPAATRSPRSTPRTSTPPRTSPTPIAPPTTTATPTPPDAPTGSPTETPSETPTVAAAPASDTGSKAGPVAALIGALIVLAVVGAMLYRRRGAA